MAYSPAAVQSRTEPETNHVNWPIVILAVLAAAVVVVLGFVIAHNIDDGTGARSDDVTTVRTSPAAAPLTQLTGSDLGGVLHHRSGNLP